jgi:hypothetical protein
MMMVVVVDDDDDDDDSLSVVCDWTRDVACK